MGPTPRENQRDGVDEDGWYIGYEVQMEGVGIVNVYGETANTESESGTLLKAIDLHDKCLF